MECFSPKVSVLQVHVRNPEFDLLQVTVSKYHPQLPCHVHPPTHVLHSWKRVVPVRSLRHGTTTLSQGKHTVHLKEALTSLSCWVLPYKWDLQWSLFYRDFLQILSLSIWMSSNSALCSMNNICHVFVLSSFPHLESGNECSDMSCTRRNSKEKETYIYMFI